MELAPARKHSACVAAAHALAPGRQADDGAGHGDAGHRDGAHEIDGIERFGQCRWGSGHRYQRVDRHALGVIGQGGQGMDHAHAVIGAFAHADNAAAADIHARIPHGGQRVEPVLVCPCADDLPIIFGRGVDIVVVIVETRLLQALCLGRRQHAKRDAAFQAQRLDAFNHGADRVQILVLGAAPCGAHAEARGPGIARGARLGQHGVQRHQLFRLDAGVILRGLGAIGAVFGATAGLDGKQG